MTDWYSSLSAVERVLFLVGIFSTLIFAIQFVLTFVGLSDDSDADGNDGAVSIADVFTIRNGVSFLMGFSWGGLMALGWGIEMPLVIAIVGFTIGSTLVGLNMLLLFAIAQLRHDGSIKLENAISQQATVTLPIPGGRQGIGKVRVPIQGRLKEYHAITDGPALSRNTAVTVLDISASQLIVAASNA